MSRNLSEIYHKFNKFIDFYFTGTTEFFGILFEINKDNNQFLIETCDNDNKKKRILCKHNLQLDLSIGDKIIVGGKFVIGNNNISDIFINVEYIHTQKEFNYDKYLRTHRKYNTALTTIKKYIKIINRFHETKLPNNIKNIGIIVFNDSNNDFINNFRGYAGNVYIYRLDRESVEFTLISGLQYFKKYHDIDVIYLLTDQLTAIDVCNLSTRLIVKYLLNRKEFPYIISILPSDYKDSNLKPISSLLSNICFYSTDDAIKCIIEKQEKQKEKINNAYQKCLHILQEIITSKKNKLHSLTMYAMKIYGIDFDNIRSINKSNDTTIEKLTILKLLVANQLKQKIVQLSKIEIDIMKKMIDDDHFQLVFNTLIKNETDTMTKLSLKQNPYFQTNPEKANTELNKMNDIVNEFKNLDTFNKKIDLLNPNINNNFDDNIINNGGQI
ncbi:hypothetical protein CE11_00560 [Megavirus courdo11]|uniref:Uncharacterized protein n=3 Tax=Megavirus TaxID=3044761 RepID=K7Z880_9VIRU|nr:hypothetical protein c7_L619 [Megavirus courdo7]AFX92586.1 hypothetical protein CE11_00560 [Megavirus courdo11]AUV58474.1 hypothetical protein [Bandra megavirus]AVL93852.1 hypothetical protein mvi_492 [Megavirus vitis]